jgi:hypothetical protein
LNFILELQKPVDQTAGHNMGQKDHKNSDIKDLKDIKESEDKAKTKKPEILITKEDLYHL